MPFHVQKPDLAAALQDLGDDLKVRHTRASALLDRWGNPPALAALLREILIDDEWLRTAAEDSYGHALGFDKIVVAAEESGAQLRLHLWWPEQARKMEDVHDHRYAFSSRVVHGSLINRVFRTATQGGEARIEFREMSDPRDHRWTFQRMGVRHIVPAAADVHDAGCTYLVSSDALHVIDVPEGIFAGTLYVQHPLERDWSRVLASTESFGRSAPQIRFTESELAQRLERAVALMGVS